MYISVLIYFSFNFPALFLFTVFKMKLIQCSEKEPFQRKSKMTSWLTMKPQNSYWITPSLFIKFFLSFSLILSSPALFALQQPSVSGDLSLQPHLGVEELAVALALGGQPTPHLLQLALQPSDHLGKILQLAGVKPLGVLQGALQAFLLKSKR